MSVYTFLETMKMRDRMNGGGESQHKHYTTPITAINRIILTVMGLGVYWLALQDAPRSYKISQETSLMKAYLIFLVTVQIPEMSRKKP